MRAVSAPSFTWHDGERLVRFGRGTLADAPALLGDGFTLLTTARGLALAPELAERAATVHEVRAGNVDEVAGELHGTVEGELLVALGGGRVIDTAKALAAAAPAPTRVAAIPTTLSAAEMTRVHRRAAGTDPQAPGVRPAIVVNDPELSASQPEDELAASTANSLAHAVEGAVTTQASPVPVMAAQRAAQLIGAAYGADAGEGADPDRDALALAALLSGSTIDSAWYGLHHVLAQTLVRLGGVPHGKANAVLLPHTIGALRRRRRAELAVLEAAVPEPLEALAGRLANLAGAARLRQLMVGDEVLDRCAHAAASRPELELTPPAAGEEELRALYAEAL